MSRAGLLTHEIIRKYQSPEAIVLTVLAMLGPCSTRELKFWLPGQKKKNFSVLWKGLVEQGRIVVLQESSSKQDRIFGLPQYKLTNNVY